MASGNSSKSASQYSNFIRIPLTVDEIDSLTANRLYFWKLVTLGISFTHTTEKEIKK